MNNDSLTFCFLIWMSFILFSFLIPLASTSRTVNRSSEGIPLSSDLREKAFILSLLSMMLAVALLFKAFIM